MSTGKVLPYNQKGELLLEEYDRNRMRDVVEDEFNSALRSTPHSSPIREPTTKLMVRFEAQNGEKIYRMGQYQRLT